MKKLVILITFICVTTTSRSQIHEIGVLIGGSNYIGDIGSVYYVINPNNIMGGFIYKWNKNPRVAFRGSFTYSKISANDKNASNIARVNRNIHFNNSIKELAVGLEFSFFKYNIDDYRQTHTPYLLLEIAAYNYNVVEDESPSGNYNYVSKTSFALPFGLGYKTKLIHDFAISFEARARYTFNDQLDYNNQNINSLTFGNPNSNDWYIFTGISIVYTFGRPPCYATPY